MAIEGPLRELALSDVFQLLDLSRKTGVLTITHESRHRPAVVRFDRGAVTGAELGEAQERIGHLLLRAGKVTERHGAARRSSGRAGRPGESWWSGSSRRRRPRSRSIEEAIYGYPGKDGYFR